jgi:hypothetical protein
MPFDRQLIEAKISLDLIASADMPDVACEALEAELDGPAIRRLASLQRPTYFEVRDVLAGAMEEMGLREIPHAEAARRLAQQIAQNILNGNDDPLQHVRDFESLWIRSGYPKTISSLGTLHDDIWIAESTGQSQKQIREWVIARLKEFAETANPLQQP